jgi:glycosyl hydrolase family 28/pectate lyase-like protein
MTCGQGTSAAQNTAPPQANSSRANEFNVLDFGARADGQTLNTNAITAAVLAAAKVGGGTITFPPGRYRTGTFRLVSNLTLQLQAGAVLEGSKDLSDYGEIADYGLGRVYGTNSSGEGTKVGIVFARNVENIAIVGPGIIDGNGDSFFDPSTPHFSMDFDPSVTRQGQRSLDVLHRTGDGPIAAKPAGRPGTMIVCFDCKNVVIRDVTFRNAPNWTAHFQNVERAVVSGLHVLNNPLIPNNDGFDCFGCKDVHFSNCDIHTGDDDFAIVNSVDVTVASCTLSSRSSGIRLEASQFNMFENLAIHSNRGIAIFERGSGKTDHISFANIRIETQLFTGHWWGKGEPIYIAVGKPQNGAGSGEISNVTFSNISGDAESSIVLYGHPDAWLHNIVLENVHFTVRATRKDVSDLVGGNFDFRWTATNLKEAVFKHDIPGIYGRYLDGLHIQNSSIAWGQPASSFFSNGVELEDFRNLEVSEFRGSNAPGIKAAAFRLRNGEGVSIRNSTAASGTNVFLDAHRVSGKRVLMHNDLANAATALTGDAVQFTQRGNYLGKQPAQNAAGR